MERGGSREGKEEGKVKLGEWQVAYKYIYKAAGEYIIGRAKRAPHRGVQSRFRVIYIYMCVCVCVCVCRGPKSVGGITWAKRAHAQSQYWEIKSDQCHLYYSFRLYARAALAWTEEKRSLRNEKLKAKQSFID